MNLQGKSVTIRRTPPTVYHLNLLRFWRCTEKCTLYIFQIPIDTSSSISRLLNLLFYDFFNQSAHTSPVFPDLLTHFLTAPLILICNVAIFSVLCHVFRLTIPALNFHRYIRSSHIELERTVSYQGLYQIKI